MLQSLLWPDEVREANFPSLDASIKISSQERDMSAALVESMAADFDPASFTDEYQVQLRQLIEAKLEQGESLDTEETFGVEAGEGGKGEVIDLMEALKRSLDRKRGGGEAASSGTSDDEADTGDEEAEAAKPARKSSGTKASGTKTAASKSTASKTTASKTSASKSATKSTASKATASKAADTKSTGTKSAAAKSTGTKTAEKPAAKTTRARKPA